MTQDKQGTSGKLNWLLGLALVFSFFSCPAHGQEVLDLSTPEGPALAYGRLANGTSAWLSQLDGQRDQWGNEQSAGYVSAARPDALATALLDFLQAWFKDHPELGIRIARGPIEASIMRSALEAELSIAAAEAAARLAEEVARKASKENKEDSSNPSLEKSTDKTQLKDPSSSEDQVSTGEDVPDLTRGDTSDKNPTTGDSPGDFPSDFAGVKWLHTDVSGWEQTANLNVSIGSSQITLDYDKASSWPSGNDVGLELQANPWIFVKQDGTWYAATWEWMRPGSTSKSRKAVAGDHIKKSPLQNFKPVSGERYGFMVSGLARGGTRTVKERSNVVWVTWP